MTDEEILALAEKTYKDKTQESCVFCDDCPMFICANSKGCVLTAYKQGFLDGFKAGYKKGQDSMSDYVMELQHAAYDD